jgi:hypothetical protein
MMGTISLTNISPAYAVMSHLHSLFSVGDDRQAQTHAAPAATKLNSVTAENAVVSSRAAFEFATPARRFLQSQVSDQKSGLRF